MRYLRRFLLALGGEALQSGLHFALNLALIRSLTKEDYGLFASVFLLAGWAVSLGNAAASTHVAVRLPRASTWAQKRLTEAVFASVSLYLSLALLVLTLGPLLVWTGNLALACSGALLPALWTLRNHTRAVAYARFRPGITALADLSYCCAGTVAALCTFIFSPSETLLIGAFSTLAVANVVGIGTAIYLLSTPFYAVGHRALRRLYKPVMAETLWMILGVTTTALQTMGYAPLVAALAGPAAVAPLAAGNVLFGPVRTAIAAWQNSMRPDLAQMVGQGRFAAARSFCTGSAVAIIVAALVAGIVLFLVWSPLEQFLFSKRYSEEPMRRIVLLWWVSTAFFALRAGPSGVAQALFRFKELAWASLYGSVITVVLTALLLWAAAPWLAPLGNTVAEAIVAVWIWRLAGSSLSPSSSGGLDFPKRRD